MAPHLLFGAPMKPVNALASLAVVVCSACGSPSAPAKTMGTVVFTMDGVSCKYVGTRSVTFYIAAAEVGTQSMGTNVASTGYLTKVSASYPKAGNPVVQARVGNYTATGGALWTARSPVLVTGDNSTTHMFTC